MAEAAQTREPPLSYRIFLASPGDVADERNLARSVIEQVRSERAFSGRVDLKAIAWDQPGVEVAMEAGLTPQDAIAQGLPKPSECDLVVVILWSRIGTPLPPRYTKPDGTGYLSGTEWEYCDAIAAFHQTGRPLVWVYRRTEDPKLSLKDPERDRKLQQWELLTGFLDSLVNADGSIEGGINPYEAPDDFRRAFEQHLRDRLTWDLETARPEAAAALPTTQPEAAAAPPRWLGVPYPGLEAFTPEQAPIFFGRGPEIDQLIQGLRDGARFQAVVGASGSGKSSLVAAGLLPRLRAGALEFSARWRDLVFKPGERGDDPFLALAYALKPALGATGQRESDLAAALRTEPDTWEHQVAALLEGRPPGAELVVVVDQFEELLTVVQERAREAFIAFLARAADAPRVRIIATMRADFYGQALDYPMLAKRLRGRGGTFALAPPGVGALHEMITGPARAAGLELGEGLMQAVLDEAGTAPGALSLMAFALHALWDRNHATGRLTLEGYRAIGGVEGALRQRADAVLQALAPAGGRVLQSRLDRVFLALVEVNEQGVATRRRAALQPLRRDRDTRRLLDALVDARLLVTGKGESDEPTVEVAHEALLTRWPRLQQWIDRNAADLRARRDLERAAQDWAEAGKPRWRGLPAGKITKRYQRVPSPSALAATYLRACRQAVWLVRLVIYGMATVFLAAGAFLLWTDHHRIDERTGIQVLLTRLGLRAPPPEPAIVNIKAGCFQMGSPPDEEGRYKDERQHKVCVTAFGIGRFEVTFKEYDVFANTTRRRSPSDFDWGRGDRPVVDVSWDDATAYARWLSLMTGKHYRLPTEAEWEYAARADTATAYSFGDDESRLGEYAWYSENSGRKTQPVGGKKPNGWGLYDVHGNVWEWVQDWYGEYSSDPAEDPQGPDAGSYRVDRGGGWFFGAGGCRSALRVDGVPGLRDSYLGFRLSRLL